MVMVDEMRLEIAAGRRYNRPSGKESRAFVRSREMPKGTQRRRKPRQTASKAPQLLAFLLCERVESNSGLHTLVNVFNRRHANVQVAAAPDEQIPALEMAFEFTVFVRFGGGTGTFKHWLEIHPPSGETQQGPETDFWLRDPGKAHNIVTRFQVRVTESGRNWIVCFLDGHEVARTPWDVEINVQRTPRPGS